MGSRTAATTLKGIYITGQFDPADDPAEEIGDGNCWCNKTQNVMGPDDGMVDRLDCNAARNCYQANV